MAQVIYQTVLLMVHATQVTDARWNATLVHALTQVFWPALSSVVYQQLTHWNKGSSELPECPSDATCQPGFQCKRECNTCTCTDTGVLACTKIGCLRAPTVEE
ncbi:uncharacterized protein LOC124154093 [Ischnura elegans]|uniref:uncharacterized protein LOC124154093 n=1 Tax=Ischnura elegans TaxID=197161 RepID=UPI001ED86CEF|nr:uncharacterized protein LOC124154093 [Ischnura elegans]